MFSNPELLKYSRFQSEEKLKWLAVISEFIRLALSPEVVQLRKFFEAKNFKNEAYGSQAAC